MKRICDIINSLLGLIVLGPLMLVIAVAIKATSKGPVFFKQTRTGLDEKAFYIYKFRIMIDQVDKRGTSHIADDNPRITSVGRFLRKTHLDELPQLFNVLKGDMSFVGPRPGVPEITISYPQEMKRIFSIRPGITNLSTLHLRNEEEILSKVADREKFYEERLVPLKFQLSMQHVQKNSFFYDLKILLQTLWVLTPLNRIWPVKEHKLVTAFKNHSGLTEDAYGKEGFCSII